MFKCASILLVEKGEALVVSENMGNVGINAAVFTPVANVEVSDG